MTTDQQGAQLSESVASLLFIWGWAAFFVGLCGFIAYFAGMIAYYALTPDLGFDRPLSEALLHDLPGILSLTLMTVFGFFFAREGAATLRQRS